MHDDQNLRPTDASRASRRWHDYPVRVGPCHRQHGVGAVNRHGHVATRTSAKEGEHGRVRLEHPRLHNSLPSGARPWKGIA